MIFPVPWRALLPADAIPLLNSNANGLKEISTETGAHLHLSGDGETPETLSDKILTLSGTVEQKEASCRRIVDMLRQVQEVTDDEPGVFVIIVPSCAVPMVVGQKGAQIKEVIELSGAQISVGKDMILGMLDQPIGITGTAGQVVSAVSKVNAILQDLADRGRMQPADFKYRPGLESRPEGAGGLSGPPLARGAVPLGGGNPRTNVKFVVATQIAGWIIGKQGRHIRELQENSGAHIQVMKEGEVPPGVSPVDRVLQVGGRFEAKVEGISIVLVAIDSMPALQAPRETQMLVLKALVQGTEKTDVQQMSGAELDVRELPDNEEALVTLVGTVEARVKAAQRLLTRLEESVQDGSLGATPFAQQPQSERAACPSAMEPRPPYSQPQPATAEKPQIERAAAPSQGQTGGSCSSGPCPASIPASGTMGSRDSSLQPALPPPQQPQQPSQQQQQQQQQPSQPHSQQPLSQQRPLLESAQQQSHVQPSQPSLPQEPQEPQHPSQRPLQQQEALQQEQQCEQQCKQQATQQAMQQEGHRAPQQHAPNSTAESAIGTSFSFSPSGIKGVAGTDGQKTALCSAATAATGVGASSWSFQPSSACQPVQPQQHGVVAAASMEKQLQSPAPSMSFSPGGASSISGCPPSTSSVVVGGGIRGAGGGGYGPASVGTAIAHEVLFRAALQDGMSNFVMGQLLLLLPAKLLHQALIPQGHLAEIARTCGIHIELGAEVSPNMVQVSLAGGVIANAMAVFFLQERVLQLGGV